MSTWQRVVVCAVGLLLPCGAVADNTIHQWSGDPNDVQIVLGRWVYILAPGTFGFEALDVDPNDPNTVLGLGYFQEISVDPNCPAGTVNVYILRDPNEGGGAGAVDVYYLHLVDPNVPGVTGNIAELNITGDLGQGQNDPIKASNAGPLTVDGALRCDLVIDDDITGDIALGTLRASISCDSMQDLTVAESEEPLAAPPSITVREAYGHAIDVPGDITQLQIGGEMSGSIAIGGSMAALTVIGALSGSVTIGGALEDLDIGGALSGSFALGGTLQGGLIDGDVSGTLWIGTDLDDPYLHSGLLKIDGDLNGTSESPALISIGRDLVSTLQVNGEIGPYARIEVARDLKAHTEGKGLHTGLLLGTVYIGNELQGWIKLGSGAAGTGVVEVVSTFSGGVHSLQTFEGRLTVGANMTGEFDVYNNIEPGRYAVDLTGSVAVAGDCSGVIYVDGLLDDPGDPAEPNNPHSPLSGGHVIIDGGLLAGAWIEFSLGMAGQTEFVTVNYDAYGLETWDPEATIVLGDGEISHYYHENTPAHRLWAVTPCRGDLNNSGDVGFGDINPYIMAKNYPDTYALTYPGLGAFQTSNTQGSRVWHGDANCDGTFDTSDDNPFVALVIAQCCDPDCPGCQGDRGEGGEGSEGPPDLAAEDLAAELAAYVWPELYDGLLAMVLETIDAAPNEEVQAYWQAVYAALTQ